MKGPNENEDMWDQRGRNGTERDKAKHDKPVPMEVDALLAKVTALMEGRNEGCEASEIHGTETDFFGSCGGRSQHQEEETWSDHSSVTFDKVEQGLPL